MSSHPQAPEEEYRGARYAVIRKVLGQAIESGAAEPGLVLLERPLAELFGTSRAPVRRALDLLCDAGLIARFSGRGYVVARHGEVPEPKRRTLTAEALGLAPSAPLLDTRSAGEKLYDELFELLSTCMIFGHYQVDEGRAGEHFDVSRSVIREALLRLRDRGLVEKAPYSQWVTGPVTAQEVRDDYEMRWLLEPRALQKSAASLALGDLREMIARIDAMYTDTAIDLVALDRIEDDLHLHCLACCDNRRMTSTLRQVQMPLTINRLFYSAIGRGVHLPGLAEHRLVLDLLMRDQRDAAVEALRTHLVRARDRTLERLKSLSVFPEPAMPDFVKKIS